MPCSIRPATAADVALFYGTSHDVQVAVVDGRPVAIGGLVEEDGRLWAFFNVRDGADAHSVRIVRLLHRGLSRTAEVRDTVFVACDAAQFPQAPRLLRLLGFTPTSETRNGLKVWKCPG